MSLVLTEEFKEKTFEEILSSLRIIDTIKSSLSSLTISLLAAGFASVEGQDCRVSDILLNDQMYDYLKVLCKDYIDLEYDTEVIKKGQTAYMWGATILVSKIMPDNTALLLSEPRYKIAAILKTNGIENEEHTQTNK